MSSSSGSSLRRRRLVYVSIRGSAVPMHPTIGPGSILHRLDSPPMRTPVVLMIVTCACGAGSWFVRTRLGCGEVKVVNSRGAPSSIGPGRDWNAVSRVSECLWKLLVGMKVESGYVAHTYVSCLLKIPWQVQLWISCLGLALCWRSNVRKHQPRLPFTPHLAQCSATLALEQWDLDYGPPRDHRRWNQDASSL